MKIKITLDKYSSSMVNTDALTTIIRELGSKATIKGNEIIVDSFDETKVVDILNRRGVTRYERSQSY